MMSNAGVCAQPSCYGKECAMQTRRRFKQTDSLLDRLSGFIAGLRQEAAGMQEGPEREKLLKKIRQAETASEIEGWANSPELQPPK
jgi:hypothetical protein